MHEHEVTLMRNLVSTLVATTIFALTFANVAQAYVGPGAGLSAIGSLLALILGLMLAVLGFIWYPLKRLIKGKGDSVQEIPSESEADLSRKDSLE